MVKLKVVTIINKLRESQLKMFWTCQKETTNTASQKSENTYDKRLDEKVQTKTQVRDRLKLDMKELNMSEDTISCINFWSIRIMIDE